MTESYKYSVNKRGKLEKDGNNRRECGGEVQRKRKTVEIVSRTNREIDKGLVKIE